MTELTVLVVEDDADIAATYEMWLRSHEVRIATTGQAALDSIDDAVDLVLLDRMMPGMSGDETLVRIRDGDHDPLVAVVSAVDPSADVLDLPFDAYITKPVDRETIATAAEALARRADRSADERRYCALAEKRALVEAMLPDETLADDERYEELCRDLDAVDAVDLSSLSLVSG